MLVVKPGKIEKALGRCREPNFKFRCEYCECEWLAWSTEKGLTISPLNHAVTCCPQCGQYTASENESRGGE